MRESYLNILTFNMYDRIDDIIRHLIVKQILQTVSAQNPPAVIHDGQSAVQISIIAEHRLDDIIMEPIVLKERSIRLEVYVCTRLIVRRFSHVPLGQSALEYRFPHLSVAIRTHLEVKTERIDSLDSHALLKSL